MHCHVCPYVDRTMWCSKAASGVLQILVEQSLVDALELEWTGAPGLGPLPAAPLSHIALRNHALLVHRQEVDRAASQSFCSRTSLSGWLAIFCAVRCTHLGLSVGLDLTHSNGASENIDMDSSLPQTCSGVCILLQKPSSAVQASWEGS